MFKTIKAIFHLIRNPPNPNWHIEKQAKPCKTHPLGGFWKIKETNEFGLAIGKASDDLYFISFCGPGGCFEKGAYRPNTAIHGDPAYRVIDKNTIEVKDKNGFKKYIRCKNRKNT